MGSASVAWGLHRSGPVATVTHRQFLRRCACRTRSLSQRSRCAQELLWHDALGRQTPEHGGHGVPDGVQARAVPSQFSLGIGITSRLRDSCYGAEKKRDRRRSSQTMPARALRRSQVPRSMARSSRHLAAKRAALATCGRGWQAASHKNAQALSERALATSVAQSPFLRWLCEPAPKWLERVQRNDRGGQLPNHHANQQATHHQSSPGRPPVVSVPASTSASSNRQNRHRSTGVASLTIA